MRITRAQRRAAVLIVLLMLLGATLFEAVVSPVDTAQTEGDEQPGAPAKHEPILGRVVAVADGDTVTVLDAARQQHRIRLSGIDAPERGQAGGHRSKESLSDLIYDQPVRVDWRKRDRYGRVLGIIYVAPPDAICRGDAQCPATLDAGLEQLNRGRAWWYRQFAADQTPDQRSRYEHAEAQARARRIGLWRDGSAQPPWEFRRQNVRRPEHPQ
jgi:endonuclease YncB( thermonuclease family)